MRLKGKFNMATRTPSPTFQRDEFATRLGVLAATLGSAVGLGNIWKFPALTGENGGAAFLVIYLLSAFLVGLPVMISEQLMGRHTRANAVSAFQKLAPRTPWWLVGALGVAAAFFILAFYSEVAGWVFAYIFRAITAGAPSTNPEVNSQAFTALVTNPVMSLVWQWLVLAMIGFIIILGVSGGIEKVTKRLMPILFGLLIIICIRSLTLPGASEGLKFLFQPDFSKVTGMTFVVAMGLAFFKLSTGMGTMITYGSYFRQDQDIPLTATRVMLADLLVSLLAGMAVFPAVFAFGFQPDAGPSLLFITLPAVFASMPFGQVFMVMFFILVAIAATGAMISILEVPVALLTEKWGISRRTATLAMVGLLAVVGAPAALSNSTTADFKLFGKTMFDLYDFASSNLMLPLGGIFISLFVGWVWSQREVAAAITNDGKLANGWLVPVFMVVVKFITPLLVTGVLLNGLGLF
jgi:NSS family neurotransmitter:Na+ symporter